MIQLLKNITIILIAVTGSALIGAGYVLLLAYVA